MMHVGALCRIIATETRLDQDAWQVGLDQPARPLAWLRLGEPVIILCITDDWSRFQVLSLHGSGWMWAGHCKRMQPVHPRQLIDKFHRGKRTSS